MTARPTPEQIADEIAPIVRQAGTPTALRQWKAEALEVLKGWDAVYELVNAVDPGPLGGSKAEHVARWVKRNLPVEQHVYKPLHPSPNTVGIGVGPCQHPGCTEPANSTVHGALGLGITRAPHKLADPDEGPLTAPQVKARPQETTPPGFHTHTEERLNALAADIARLNRKVKEVDEANAAAIAELSRAVDVDAPDRIRNQ